MTRLELSERDWQRQVLQLATLYRWTWFHPYDSRRSPAGFPDLVLVRERVVFAELKKDTGRLSTNQLCWQNLLNNAGAEVYVWRPRDVDAVRATLGVPGHRRAAAARTGVGASLGTLGTP